MDFAFFRSDEEDLRVEFTEIEAKASSVTDQTGLFVRSFY